MATNIERIVQVNVTKTSAAISRQGFGTPLGVHQVSDTVQASRYNTYTTVQELLDAGFPTDSTAVAWATNIKGQNPAPVRFAIGRRVPGVAKVYEYETTASDVGTWVWSVTEAASGYAKNYHYIAGATDDLVSITEGLRQQIAQDPEALVTVPGSATGLATVDVTAAISGTDFVLAVTPPGAGTGTTTETTANTDPEDLDTTLPAIEAENSKDWFFFNIDTRTDGDLTKAAAFAWGRRFLKMFVGQTKDPDILTNAAPNIGTVLGDLNYTNVVIMWHGGDAIQCDAAMTGIAAAADLDAENGVITWANQQLGGVPVSDLQPSQIDNIIANNCNAYVEIASLGAVLEGKSVEGEFADVETTFAWAKARTQEAVAQVLLTTPTKVPYDDDGIASIQAATQGVARTGVTARHYSAEDPEFPRTRVPTKAEIRANSPADINNRELRNVVTEAILSGAIHKTLQQINISI